MTLKNKNNGADERERSGSQAATGDSLQAYLRAIARFQPLSPEEEKDLGRRIRVGDEEALNRLVESNLRFVVSYAKRYHGSTLSLLDLIHEGNLGLIEAAKRFDPGRNVRFISYAVWWIRQAILNTLLAQAHPFRLPRRVAAQVQKVRNAEGRLTAELDRAPTGGEIAQKLALNENDVEKLRSIGGSEISLSSTLGEDDSLQLIDTIEQEAIPPIEEDLIHESFMEQVRALLDRLDQREREVIILRFGLDGEDPRTLQQIGDSLALTRERVRQIESRAMDKLRRMKAAQGLRGYLN